MNKYEEQAGQQRKAALRSSMSVWTAGLSLIIVALAILGFRGSAPPQYFYKGALAVAILLLLLRRWRGGSNRECLGPPGQILNLP